MNQWRQGYGETREIYELNPGEYFCFKTHDPREERIVELTDDYRDEHGDFIPPEISTAEPLEDRLSSWELWVIQ